MKKIINDKYKNIPIPSELNECVENALDYGLKTHNKRFAATKKILLSAAAFFIISVTLINTNSTIASALYQIPVIGNIAHIFTIQEIHKEDDIQYIDVKIPKIENTGKSDLEQRVNLEISSLIDKEIQNAQTRAKEYYDAFIATGGTPEEYHPIAVQIDYEIKLIDEKYVSFVIWKNETLASAYTTFYFYNIDVESGRVMTLKDFLGPQYKEIVSQKINEQIADWDEDKKMYLFPDVDISSLINENTKFYIDTDFKPVVVFEKYEITAGAAGIQEFKISD